MRILKEHLLPRCKSNGPDSYWTLARFVEVQNGMIFECLDNSRYQEINKKLFEGYQKHADENYKDHFKPCKS